MENLTERYRSSLPKLFGKMKFYFTFEGIPFMLNRLKGRMRGKGEAVEKG